MVKLIDLTPINLTMPVQLPSVTVLMPAYNYDQYVGRAVQSALDQDYPPELLRVVVVDDGSTDATAAVVEGLAQENPGRVTLIRQANSGASAAVNRALAEADGDLVAVLDADDIWLPQKTRRQAQLLRDDPSLGMVFCDMRVVDQHERTVRPSQVGEIGVFPRRAFAALLCQNVATQSSILIRRELAKPLPPEAPYSDWWFALCAAERAEVEYLRDQLALYREHGANLTSSVSGSSAVREHRKEISFQLWAIRHLDLSSLQPAEVLRVWGGVEEHARRALVAAGSHFLELAQVGDRDRESARALAAEARTLADGGDLPAACVQLLKARACNPFDPELGEALSDAVQRAQWAATLSDPLEGARERVILADAEALLADESLLLEYAKLASGREDITLAIDASRMPEPEATREVTALVERCGLSDSVDVDLIAVVGELDPSQRHRMERRSAPLDQLLAASAPR